MNLRSTLKSRSFRSNSAIPLLLTLLALPCSLSCGFLELFNIVSFATSPPGTTTTLILIRHAERDPGDDPPLNAEGVARAQTLNEVLAENGISAIHCPDILRNRQTIEPIAETLGIEPKFWTAANYVDTAAFADAVVNDLLANFNGQTILFVGNRGSTSLGTTGINEEIYKRLGGTGRPPERYQDMYIIVIPDEGPAHFIKTIYGPESSLD